jgi:ankyrin repeat protein
MTNKQKVFTFLALIFFTAQQAKAMLKSGCTLELENSFEQLSPTAQLQAGNITAATDLLKTECTCDEDEKRALLFGTITLDDTDETNVKFLNTILDCPGVDVNSVDEQNNTALHKTAVLDKPKFAQTLLEHGADAQKQNVNWNTVLHIAFLENRLSVAHTIILYLYRQKILFNPNVENNAGLTVIDCAYLCRNKFYTQTVRVYFSHGNPCAEFMGLTFNSALHKEFMGKSLRGPKLTEVFGRPTWCIAINRNIWCIIAGQHLHTGQYHINPWPLVQSIDILKNMRREIATDEASPSGAYTRITRALEI